MNALEVIQPHPTWEILDSSKLIQYIECPRKFFFHYMLGWRTTSPNNHLVFGSAWHSAMEHLLLNGCEPHNVAEACLAFLTYYRKHLPPETDELFEPKTPLAACNAIEDYAAKFKSEYSRLTVLHTELAGLVMVSPQRTMVFKCDAILQDENGTIFGRDFKTSQRHYLNWGEHWVLSTQMLTYLHALYCLFPNSEPNDLHMTVRCAFIYKRQPTTFEDYPIRKLPDQMQAWLARTNVWIDLLQLDMDVLANDDSPDLPAMTAFPQRESNCFSYGRRCEFFDFCNAWANPLTRCEEPPIGFNVEWWDPLGRPEIRERIDLTRQEGAKNAE